MDIPYGTASIHIKNGESKRIPRNVSWETEGRCVALEASSDGSCVLSSVPDDNH